MSRRFLIGLGMVVIVGVCGAGLDCLADPARPFTWPGVYRAAAYKIGELRPDDFRSYREAFKLARGGRWSRARRVAAKAHDPLLRKVLDWLELTESGRPRFAAIADFIDENPDWPRAVQLRRRAEAALDDTVSDATALAWFGRHEPVTTKGATRYAVALLASGATAEGERRLKRAWIEGDFNARGERAFLKRHRHRLTKEDHEARLDRLLWDGDRRAAQRMMRRVGKGWRALAKARAALRRNARGVDWVIAQVPDELKVDPGLIYERLRWRRRKGKFEAALEMLETAPQRIARPELWWNERAYLARVALAKGEASVAYRVARRHGQTDGVGFAEGEWLAGWIALRFLDDHVGALEHFKTLYESVSTPISRTRGAYWGGRAAEALGDRQAADRWYRLAAQHITTFYGQLAAARLGQDRAAELPDGPAISAREMEAFYGRELVRVVRLLAEIGEDELVRLFIRQLNAIAKTPAERILIARVAENVDRTDLALWTARRASLSGVNLIDHGYPVMSLPEGQGPDSALIHAVIRQESGFDPRAVSRTGARGLMQLLPATARKVSHRLKARYSKDRLTVDPDYNVMLGRAHLARLIEDFKGSYVLALAAYNAGPKRVGRWIKQHGNPRQDTADAVDWIELIPLTETRNYIQRVLEGLFVYRRRLGPSNVIATLEDALR
ncbi:MAG: lytic transglycosylase domain-containing protein [Kiloniellales bacterium]